MAKSVEERVEDFYKSELDKLDIKRYTKTESINSAIDMALQTASSKSGGTGRNYPDIQLLLDNGQGRQIPVMIEVKGTQGKLISFDKDGFISDDTKAIVNYAVNGAVHYGQAILTYSDKYNEVLIIGANGHEQDDGSLYTEHKAYYMSRVNGTVPVQVKDLNDDLVLLKSSNISKLFKILDDIVLSDEERETAKRRVESRLEASVQKIHQAIYEDDKMKNLLDTNEKLYLLCGLIMAGLPADGVAALEPTDFKGNKSDKNHDGVVILNRVQAFLDSKRCTKEKLDMIISLLSNVFNRKDLWMPHNGISMLSELYQQVKYEVIPYLTSQFHLDFAGLILNRLSDWTRLENNVYNDVVLTPRYVTVFMARLCKTNMDSLVWDRAMGSAGFLVSAMDIMIRDARARIKDEAELEAKIKHIKEEQLLGIEILGNVYLLAVLNMILMGDGSSSLICGDSHKWQGSFDANVFLLNPPYSAPGKGFNFVEEALSCMHNGYAAILIQENAGAGQGGEYTKRILKNNTLLASIHMPDKLFSGKASVQTAIYVFKVNRPHEPDDIVKFIDFTNDGYSRQNRKKSTQEVNLRDTDNAVDRYAEVEALILGKKPKTNYYTQANGLYIEDVIGLDGDDWTFAQHKKIDTIPTEEDFKKTVADYLAWKVSCLMRGEVSGNGGTV